MIKHVFKDGRTLDSINGIVVPSTGVTESAYRIVAEVIKRRSSELCTKKRSEQ